MLINFLITYLKFIVMKIFTGILILFSAVILSSCEGDMGHPGMDGEDGDALLGTVFEIEGDFTVQNDYTLFYKFPNDFEIFDGDVVLVYILWEQETAANGELIDIWRLLPQTLVLDIGILQYNFDYTLADVKIFIDGDINFNDLLPAETDNQIFRIAVMPAALAQSKSVDILNLSSVMKSMELDISSIKKGEILKNK
jgi:hypothetical protein